MMKHVRLLLWLLLAASLTSCDSVKKQLLSVLKETTGSGDGATSTEYTGEVVRHLSMEDFDEFTAVQNQVVIIDYYADWCATCQILAPILEQVTHAHDGQVLLGKVNVDQNVELAQKAGVGGLPDVRIYVNGKQVDRFVGAIPRNAVEQKLAPHLAKLGPKLKPKTAPAASGDTTTPDGEPEETQPVVQPMPKDWMPPGIQRP